MAASSFKGSAGRDVQLYEYGPLRFAGTDDYAASLSSTMPSRRKLPASANVLRRSLERSASYCHNIGNSASRFITPA
jgi:hypothetical protein